MDNRPYGRPSDGRGEYGRGRDPGRGGTASGRADSPNYGRRPAPQGKASGGPGRPGGRPQQGAVRRRPPESGGRRPETSGKKAPPKKPALSKEQKKQIKEQKAFLRRKKINRVLARVKRALAVFFKRALVSLLAAAVILGLYAVITLLRIVNGNEVHYTCKYVIGYEENIYLSTSYSDRVMIHGGIPYVSLDDLVGYCGFTLTGNVDERKIVLHQDNDSYVKMTAGSNNIYINGIRYRLNGEIIRQLGSFWVPMDFINKYLNGISSEYDRETHELTVKRTLTDEAGKRYDDYKKSREDDDRENDIDKSSLKFDYKSITISISPHVATDNIDEYSLSEEIKYLTDPERLAREEEERRKQELLAQAGLLP